MHQRHDMPVFTFAYVPIGYLPSKFSMTRLYRRFVHVFYSLDSFNFETTGVRLQNGPDQFILRASYVATPMGEEAIRAIKSVKGHSGIKPCIHCKNVLGRVGSLADFGDDDPYCMKGIRAIALSALGPSGARRVKRSISESKEAHSFCVIEIY